MGTKGLLVNQSGRTLKEGLVEGIGHVLPPGIDPTASTGDKFVFSAVRYLLAKNRVDVQAVNPAVWE